MDVSDVPPVPTFKVTEAPLKDAKELLSTLKRDAGIPKYEYKLVESCRKGVAEAFENSVSRIKAQRAQLIPKTNETATIVFTQKIAADTLVRFGLTYHNERAKRLKKQTKRSCGVLGKLKDNLSPSERYFAEKYYGLHGKFEGYFADYGLNLLTNTNHPKMEYSFYRGTQDYGEVEVSDGRMILVNRDFVHNLPREDAEPLLRAGVLEKVDL
uniref:DNA replication complex GINS protein PSF1 n=1 Tax=Rhabditophanes sp. KR3021 TaxID=114890 RepID=A0AC35TWS8_9BILA